MSYLSWKTRQKLSIVCCPFEKIIQFLSLDVQGAFRVREKVFIYLSTLFTPKSENPRDIAPLRLGR